MVFGRLGSLATTNLNSMLSSSKFEFDEISDDTEYIVFVNIISKSNTNIL
jgi:hypothetical protein